VWDSFFLPPKGAPKVGADFMKKRASQEQAPREAF
jgi:hypothetical protein